MKSEPSTRATVGKAGSYRPAPSSAVLEGCTASTASWIVSLTPGPAMKAPTSDSPLTIHNDRDVAVCLAGLALGRNAKGPG